MLRLTLLLPLLACGGAERDSSAADDTSDTADSADTGCSAEWYYDGDGDGVGLATATLAACEAPIGYVGTAGDCDDTRADVYPGAAETCDEADQDCDGAVDDEPTDAPLWLADTDADGYGAASSGSLRACKQPEGHVGDEGTQDCDDDNTNVHPGADERCNEADDDCDGATDEDPGDNGEVYYEDLDLDGHGTAASVLLACSAPGEGWSEDDDDCDDTAAAVNPDAAELCNDLDDDCDGDVDVAAVDEPTWYVDRDNDGHGSPSLSTTECDQPSGYAGTADDCDDDDPAVSPSADETCVGGLDDDCDGTVDEDDAVDAPSWYADADGDLYGDAADVAPACTQPSGRVADATDCDDADATSHPGGTETCDGVADEDCDGTVDEDDAADAVDHYEDADGDGYGDASTLTHSCLPAGRVVVAEDCDDADAAVAPDEAEVCGDGVDNDCDGEAQSCFLGSFTDGDEDVKLTGTTSGTFFARDAVAGDLTGDGQDDLVVLNSGGSASMFVGPVTGGTSATADATFNSWYEPSGFSAGEYVRPGAWADEDLDGDGQDDLVMWYSSFDNGLAAGLGPFSASSSFASLNRRLAATSNGVLDGDVGDVDGDGVAEVFLATYDYDIVGYSLGSASFIGTTTAGASGSGYAWSLTDTSRFDDMCTGGDLDGDGLDDLVASLGAGRLYVFDAVSASMTTADATASLGVSVAPDGVELLDDVTGDGLDDLVWAAQGASKVGYLFADPLTGGESYVTGVVGASFTPSDSNYLLRPDSADLDGDGIGELFWSGHDDVDAQAWVFYGPLSGTLVPETDADVVFLDPHSPRTAASYTIGVPVGDVLGTGNSTVLFGDYTESFTSGYGTAWLFDVTP